MTTEEEIVFDDELNDDLLPTEAVEKGREHCMSTSVSW